jgi:hypothetical protein
MYRKGLKNDVKDELIRYGGRIDTLGQIIEATSAIRDQLYKRYLERRYNKKPIRVLVFRVAPNIGRFRARLRDPDVIEIDNL